MKSFPTNPQLPVQIGFIGGTDRDVTDTSLHDDFMMG